MPEPICAFSSRCDGNMSLSYGDIKDSPDNRNNFLSGLGIDYHSLVCAKQVHASNVIRVSEPDKGRGSLSYEDSVSDTDGFITDKKGLPIAIFTADCLSIFLYDYKTLAIGLLHAGWRSSKENIAAKAIKLMQKEFNAQPKNIYAAFGPAIRSCCYRVSSDFDSFFDRNLIKRGKSYYFDLAGFNKLSLLDCGLKEKNIFDPKLCTSCSNPRFFSFRKEGKNCGRLMSVAMLK